MVDHNTTPSWTRKSWDDLTIATGCTLSLRASLSLHKLARGCRRAYTAGTLYCLFYLDPAARWLTEADARVSLRHLKVSTCCFRSPIALYRLFYLDLALTWFHSVTFKCRCDVSVDQWHVRCCLFYLDPAATWLVEENGRF